MDEKVEHVYQLSVGDIIYNRRGHYVEVLGLPRWSGNRSPKWTARVTHVRGEWVDGDRNVNYLLTDRVDGDMSGRELMFHLRNKPYRQSVRDDKIKHYFV
jgi:hypothetical protein